VGWNIAELTPFEYAATQCRVLMHYLKLAVWPSPLILDYGLPDSGVPIVRSFSQWLGWGALAPLLPLAALAALKRWPPAGFLGVTFFALLAPSSSFMPIVTEVIAEHRMYLPLAAIAVFAVLSGYRAGKWLQNRFMPGDSGRKIFIYAAIGISGALVLAAGGLTYQRNGDFDSRLSLWKQNVAARPTSARAQMNLAIELVSAGDLKSALPHFENAIRLRPDYPEGNMNLGLALERMSRSEEAMPFFLKSVQVWPDYLQGNIALGDFYFRNGRYEDACTYFRKAVRIDSQNDQARNYLGAALLQLGRVQEAQVQLEEALQLNPNLAEAHNNLGALLFNQKKLQEALDHMQTAVQLNPNSAQMHYAFGLALEQTGKLPEAFVQYRASAQADSQFQPAQAGLQRVGKKLSVPGAQASRPPTAP
jgi:Flp pilus assembly protein TadD